MTTLQILYNRVTEPINLVKTVQNLNLAYGIHQTGLMPYSACYMYFYTAK